jgi:D-alanine-D-alanine ligase
MRDRGVPTPQGLLYPAEAAAIGRLRFPCIVKPAREDASHGVHADSVVADAQAARRLAERISADYRQPALIEEFIDGREFSVAIMGEGDDAEALPLRETFFPGFAPGRPHVVTYEAKWDVTSQDHAGYDAGPPAPLDPDIARRLAEVALAAYRLFDLRDYGRVDLRLDAERGPLVIDVNPNSSLVIGVGSAASAEQKGLSYERFIGRIVESAWTRRHSKPAG